MCKIAPLQWRNMLDFMKTICYHVWSNYITTYDSSPNVDNGWFFVEMKSIKYYKDSPVLIQLDSVGCLLCSYWRIYHQPTIHITKSGLSIVLCIRYPKNWQWRFLSSGHSPHTSCIKLLPMQWMQNCTLWKACIIHDPISASWWDMHVLFPFHFAQRIYFHSVPVGWPHLFPSNWTAPLQTYLFGCLQSVCWCWYSLDGVPALPSQKICMKSI
jgi:hypothetical protein